MTDASMFDPPEEAETVSQDTVVDVPAGDTVKVRVAGLPMYDAFVVGDLTITREWTPVPADQVQSILDSAVRSKVQLEVAE